MKKLRLSANSIENVFFIHKYLRLQAYPVTTIKANVLAIPNQQRTAIRKRSQVAVCVYIKERFPISSRSPQCVLNETFGRYEKKNTTSKLCVFDNEAEHESQSNSISEHKSSPLFIHFLSIHK